MADGSRVRVSLIEESTYGTTPTTPAFLRLPVTGTTLQDRVGYTPSNVIVPNRDVDDVVRLSQAAGGTIPLELRYSPAAEGLSVSMLGLLCGTAYTASASAATCTIPGATRTITRAAFDFPAQGFVVGDVVRVSGSTVTAENGYYRVTASAVGTLTVDAPANFTAGGSAVTVTRGARLLNGTATKSYTIEVAYLDLQVAHIFRGCVLNTADLALTIGSLTTWTLGIEAQSSTRVAAVATDQFIAGATYTDMTDAPTLDPIGVAEVRMSGVDYAAQSINLSIANNVRSREQIGTLGPLSMSRGQFAVTGRLSAYFDNFTDHNAFATNALNVLWWAMLDADGKGWSIALPEVRFTDLAAPTTGANSDIFKSLTMQAFRDVTEGCTLRLQRWD